MFLPRGPQKWLNKDYHIGRERVATVEAAV
jgi:hypothetical protein